MCWYCYWGWPKQLADIYECYCDACDLDYGIGHICWADCNFETHHVEWCLKETRPANWKERYGGRADQEWDDQRAALEELLAVPEEIRCPIPDDVDGDPSNDPESFPPPSHLVMSKKRH